MNSFKLHICYRWNTIRHRFQETAVWDFSWFYFGAEGDVIYWHNPFEPSGSRCQARTFLKSIEIYHRPCTRSTLLFVSVSCGWYLSEVICRLPLIFLISCLNSVWSFNRVTLCKRGKSVRNDLHLLV